MASQSGDWLSGRAHGSHPWGHWFESSIAHHFSRTARPEDVRTQPGDLDVTHLREALRDQWAFHAVSLEYLPVGFGSHHWDATDRAGTRRFITVDDLRSTRLGTDRVGALATLERAFRAAAALRDEAGLEFAVAGIAAADGRFVQLVGDSYGVAVFPFLDGVGDDGAARPDDEDRDPILRLLGRLHCVGRETLSSLPVPEDFALPSRDDLRAALGDLEQPWNRGPYGEPHARNLLADGHGHRFLVDWDTVKLAPAERDLWMVLGEAPDLRPY